MFDRKEYNKEYREKNKEKIKEWRENNKEYMKEYMKEWREKNKEKKKEYMKEYCEKNKEKKKEYNKEYMKEYCEKNKEKRKEYNKTEIGIKNSRINRWKSFGVKCDDFNNLYEHYINTNNCEECNINLIEGNYGSNKRVLDHNHETGLFRNVLCHNCNIQRK